MTGGIIPSFLKVTGPSIKEILDEINQCKNTVKQVFEFYNMPQHCTVGRDQESYASSEPSLMVEVK